MTTCKLCTNQLSHNLTKESKELFVEVLNDYHDIEDIHMLRNLINVLIKELANLTDDRKQSYCEFCQYQLLRAFMEFMYGEENEV
jgi:hypothetical protein